MSADVVKSAQWRVTFALDILNPRPGKDPEAEPPDDARTQQLYHAVSALLPEEQEPYPTQIIRSDDGYCEITFLVRAVDRFGALHAGTAIARQTLQRTEAEAGPLRLTVTLPDEPCEPNAADDERTGTPVAVEDKPLAPDERFARAWYVDHPLAQGALKRAAIEVLDEIDEAIAEVLDGQEARNTLFAGRYLPDGFMPAYNLQFLERFRVCLVVVGYKLAQDPAIVPGCVAEELALQVIRMAAEDELERADAASPEPLGALRGLFEVCQDDDVLGLYRMQEPSDAAVAGHEPINRMLGVVDLRVEQWFEPFYGGQVGATPHPICWPQ